MPESILYCGTCGKRIPPEVAEAEDFELLGGEPACEDCLEKVNPGRKRKLHEVRSTRLRWRVERAAALAQAKAPKQTYPPPGTEAPKASSDTAVAAIKRELEEDIAPEPAVPAVALQAPPSPSTQVESLPRLLFWWVLLAAGLLAIVAMLFVPGSPADSETASGALETPRTQVTTVGTKPVVKNVVSDRPSLLPVQVALAEVELIRTQVGEAPTPAAAEVAMAKLQAIVQRADEPARSTALNVCRRYEAQVDASARQLARNAAERAEDLAAQQLFDGAVEQVRSASRKLPEASPWVQRVGRERMAGLVDRWSQERRRQLSAFSARLESELAVGNGENVEALVAELSHHPEQDFQDLARAYANQLAALREREERQRREDEVAACAAWPRFFSAWDAALALRDFGSAVKLCAPEADSALRRGGVAQPEAVLAGFAEEVERVRKLYPLVLKTALKKKNERVQLRLTAGQVDGLIQNVQDGNILLSGGDRIEIRVSPEKLSSEALAVLLADAPRGEYGPALAALRFAESARDTEDRSLALSALYQELKLPLPVCWAQRFELERRVRWRETLNARLDVLQKAVADGGVPAIRNALSQLRPLLSGGPLSKAEGALVAEAGKRVGRAQVIQLVFQNGRSPAPEFQGLRIDQIGAYFKIADQCDFELQQGLRVGSSGGLLRVLLRFDGLAEILGRGRLLKATLELYQPEGAAAPGATVALYALKPAWMPDAGSWQHADRGSKLAWEKPGASGPSDADAQPVAQVILDAQTGLWRSWDLTDYLCDVLDGRRKHAGLLMRIARDEPQFAVRFYPDGGPMTGLDDPALRPRLVVEFEKFAP
jgi:hypothetical protein